MLIVVMRGPGRRRGRADRCCTSSGVPVGDRRAVVEHDHGVAQAHDEVHVVLDDQERQTAGVQLADVALDRLDHHRVDAGGRLVEQHESRLAHQQRRELEQLALAERQRAGAVVRDARQPEFLEQRVARAPARRVPAPGAGATAMAAGRATARFSSTVSSENTRARWNVRASPARARRVGSGRRTALPAKRHGARVGRQVAGDQVEGRGLARAVRPDQRGDASLLDREAAAVDGRDAAEALRQSVDARAGRSWCRHRLARLGRRGARACASRAGRRARGGSRAAAAASRSRNTAE